MSNNGVTPLHWAVVKGHQDVAELLRQHGGHNIGSNLSAPEWNYP
jgi:ankyrin repeat protein